MELINKYFTKNPYATDGKYISGGKLKGFFLHDVATAQPDPLKFWNSWNQESYTRAGINGFIGENTTYITAPCLEKKGTVKRMPHAGVLSTNNTYIGFEMCNPATLHYNANHTAFTVDAGDLPAAKSFVRKMYDNAVELFARLCCFHGLDPLADGVILSHREGHLRGIASNHGDPEGLWNGLKMGYTMNTFRAAVAARVEELKEGNDMTETQVRKIVQEELATVKKELLAAIKTEISNAVGVHIGHIDDVPWENTKPEVRRLLDCGAINGGTDDEEDPDDVNLPLHILRAVIASARYTDSKVQQLRSELIDTEE